MKLTMAFAAGALLASGVAMAGSEPVEVPGPLQEAYLDFRTGMVTYGPSVGGPESTTVIFSAMSSPFSAFAAAPNSLGFDDYDSIDAGPTSVLDSLRFVGGVQTAGGSIRFDFYPDSTAVTPTASFTSTLPTAGNFIWTISNIGVTIPSDGELALVALNGVNGQWFLGNTAPTVGSQSALVGSTANTANSAFSHRFELTVPEPTSLSLLAMSGLMLGRRRRA